MRLLIAVVLSGSLLFAADCNDLVLAGASSPQLSFGQITSGMKTLEDFEFGTTGGRGGTQISSIGLPGSTNPNDLSNHFCPYGIAGYTSFNGEWEDYTGGNSTNICGAFNSSSTTNWSLTSDALELTATLGSGAWGSPCGGNNTNSCAINSGQIVSIDNFTPSASTTIDSGNTCSTYINSDTFGYRAYAFEIEFNFPAQVGAWPAFWLYTQAPGYNQNTAGGKPAELDVVEFFVENSSPIAGGQNFNYDQHNPFMNTHGTIGTPSYNILKLSSSGYYYDNGSSNLNNGTDFSTSYHDYQVYWTTDYRYSYLDGVLVQAVPFTWNSCAPASLIANLAFGSSGSNSPFGNLLVPTSTSELPATMDITHIKVWGR